MKRIRTILAALLILGVESFGGAAARTQAEINQAASERAARADAALNARYTETMEGMSASSRTALRRAQRAWLTFRDAECALRSSGVAGGSAAPMVEADCLAELTAARATQIEVYAECEEGDLSCPR